ncbi:GNAT family N-acetyltransferase [Yoonia sp. 2307UL14-13]|uniref:GNAT family N-acetyltransferase n=1 Tax=Yoonia sp. 2307UL14-13 TaxID=3126506 RepID=UPI00309E139E
MTPAGLARVHKAAFAKHGAWDEAAFASLLDQPGVNLIGNTRSFALIRVTLDEAELLTITTSPDYQRAGRGAKTLAAAEQAARRLGALNMFLEVAEDNTPARALYHRTGYAQVGRRPGYYRRSPEKAVAAIILRKALSTSI